MELNPKQQDLWEALKQKAWAGGKVTAMEPLLCRHFWRRRHRMVREANADYLELLAQAGNCRRQRKRRRCLPMPSGSGSTPLTEAGLPLEQLICYQSLRLTPTGTGISKPFREIIERSVIDQPLFFTPQLTGELERVVRGTGAATNVTELKNWLETVRRERLVVESFLEQYPTNTWASAPFWVNSGGRKFLLLIYGGSDDPANFHPPAGQLSLPVIFASSGGSGFEHGGGPDWKYPCRLTRRWNLRWAGGKNRLVAQ